MRQVPLRQILLRQIPLRQIGVLAAVLATAACSGAPTPPPVVEVDRGLVATSVSASGTLVSITEQNLGFAEGGELAEVLVEVGDRVEPGQVLARLDDFALDQAVERARAQVDQAQANLAKIRNGNSVEGAAAALDQSEEVLEATEDQAEATDEANEVAIERARVQLDFDREGLERADDRLADDEAACRRGGGPGAAAGGGATGTKPAPSAAAGGMPGVLAGGAEGGADPTGADPAGAGQAGAGQVPAATPAPAPAPTPDPACGRIPADETAVAQAEGAVIAAETALRTAEQRANVDAAGGRLQIENARASVVTAQNTLDLASTDRPADTGAQEAMVRDAQAALALAQDDLDDTALRAPVAGVVSEINGTAGEFLGATSGTTSLAPGSRARLPELADATGTGGGAGATGGGAFMVLNDVESFQLVVPFEESDAARVVAGQQVEVTVDALPDHAEPATVLAVAPTGENVSGIVNYYATVVLTDGDPALRDGQTAEAAVRVESVDNVLRVPSSVVRTQDGRRVVDVPGEDGESVAVPFTPGVLGDEYTEVRSGLRDGQSVLVPQGQVTSIQGGPPQN